MPPDVPGLFDPSELMPDPDQLYAPLVTEPQILAIRRAVDDAGIAPNEGTPGTNQDVHGSLIVSMRELPV